MKFEFNNIILALFFICNYCKALTNEQIARHLSKTIATQQAKNTAEEADILRKAAAAESQTTKTRTINDLELAKRTSLKIYEPADINIDESKLAFDDNIFDYINDITAELKEVLQGKTKTKPSFHLFGGPPGTGKTTLFLMLAKKLNIPLVTFNSALAQVGDVVALCTEAANYAPCIVLLDEIDTLAKSRSQGGETGRVTEILQLTNDLNILNQNTLKSFKETSSNDSSKFAKIVILSSATNSVEQLDDAVLSRSTYKYIGNPGTKALTKLWAQNLTTIFSQNLKGCGQETLAKFGITPEHKLILTIKVDDPLVKILTKKTNNYSPRELSLITETFEKNFLKKKTKDIFFQELVSLNTEKLYLKYFHKLIISILEKKRDVILKPMSAYASLLFPFNDAIKKLDENVFEYALGEEVNNSIKKFIMDIKTELTKYAKTNKPSINQINRSILFDGPPGTGKTILAQSLGKKFDFNVLEIKSSTVINSFVGSGPANIHNIFNAAKSLAPCIIFFDEIDNITPNRATLTESQANKADVITALLTEMNENDNKLDPANPVIIVGATNLASSMDPAITRRFKPNLEILYPNLIGRIAIFESVATKNNIRFDVDVINQLKNEFAKYVLVREKVEKKEDDGSRKQILFWRRPNNNELFIMARDAVNRALNSSLKVVTSSLKVVTYRFILQALQATATAGCIYSKAEFDAASKTLPQGYEHYRAFPDKIETKKTSSNSTAQVEYQSIITTEIKTQRINAIKKSLEKNFSNTTENNGLIVNTIVNLISEDEEVSVKLDKFNLFLETLFKDKIFNQFMQTLLKPSSDEERPMAFIGSKYLVRQRYILQKNPKFKSSVK